MTDRIENGVLLVGRDEARLSMTSLLTALSAATVAAMNLACTSEASVSSAIRKLVDERQLATIRLVDATRFDWDQVYLFDPYTPRSTVCATLRIQEKYCARLVPFESMDDGEMTIAFLAHGRLVHYERHSRANGDFTPVPRAQAFTPDTAVFRVVGEDGANAGHIRLRPARGSHSQGSLEITDGRQ